MVRVVIVDDAPVVRRAITSGLAGDPRIQVVGEACNREASIETASLLAPDAVLMDVEMPGRDGSSATGELRRRVSGTRIVALTAHEDAHSVVAGVFREAVRALHAEQAGSSRLDALSNGVVRSLAAAIDARDDATGGHVERVAALAGRLQPALVLPDVNLPDIDGATVVARIRAREPALRTRVVVPTGDATAATAEHLRGAGADAVLTEPVEISAPIALIDEVCPSR